MIEIMERLTPDTLARICAEIIIDGQPLSPTGQQMAEGFAQQGTALIDEEFAKLVTHYVEELSD